MTAESKRTAAFYLTVVFVAGAVLGFATSQFYAAHTAEANNEPSTAAQYRANLVSELDADLALDDDQVSEILLILDEIGERYYQVRDAMEPEFEAIRQERAERIMELLSRGQRLKYQEILDERRRRQVEKIRAYRGKQ